MLQRRLCQRVGQALAGDPRLVADRPALPVAVDMAVTQQLLGDPMTCRGPSPAQVIAAAHEITQPFLRRRGRPHEHQLPGPIQTHQLLRVPPIGLDPITGADRDQRRHDHVTRHLHARQQPVQVIAAWARLICDGQPLGPAELLHEPSDRPLGVLQANHLREPAARRQNPGHQRQLVLIDRDPGRHPRRGSRANVRHGWSSFVCGTGRSGHRTTARLTRDPANAEGQPQPCIHTD